MSRSQVSWIIRNSKGQIIGPLTTKEVLQRISEGALVGDEMISAYPQGKWTPLSKEPQFYDQLLAILEKKADEEGFKKPEKRERKVDFEETVIMPRPPQSDKPKMVRMTPTVSADPLDATEGTASNVIELEIQDPSADKKRKRKIIFLSTLALIVFLFAVILILPTGSQSDRIRLLRPQGEQAEISAEQVKQRLGKAVLGIERSGIEDIVSAQNDLVSLIEGQPRNLEARGLLCFVYKELWPFAYQDVEDQKSVDLLAQSTRSLNLTSPHGQLCDTVKMLVMGRYREARAQVDNLLETAGTFSLLPLGYYIKAEILEADRELQFAASYYEKAGEMWDTWGRPLLSLAHLKYQMKAYQEAFNLLQNMKPHHAKNKERYILLGLVEARGFQRKDNALRSLDAALNQSGRLSPTLETEAWYALAELWLEKNEKAKALQAAQKSYKVMPQNKLARELVVRLGGQDNLGISKTQNHEIVLLGDQYMRQGDCLSAQAEYKAAFEMNPKNAEAAMKAGKCLWQLNQTYDAIEWLNKAIRANPKLVSAYVTQADYLSKRYDFVKAYQLLVRAQQQASQNYEILRGFALIEYRKNNMVGAIQFGERSKSLFEGDVETYVLLSRAYKFRALSIIPENPKSIKERDEAIKNMRSYATRAVELDSTSTEAQVAYAEMLAAQHGVDTGVQYFNELIKKFSYTLEYRIGLANLLKSEERFAQALEIYEQVLNVDSKNKTAMLGLGQALRALGKNDEALRTYLRAAIVDPSDAEAFYQAGQVLMELNRFDQAISNFKKAIRVNSNYPRLYLSIGQAYLRQGQFKEAKDAALEEKKRNPNLSDPRILLAEIYHATKQYSDCAQEYSSALKLRPLAEIYVKASICYRHSGALEIAQDMLSLAKQQENGYAEIYREQGALFQLRGDNEAALESYQMYLELSPNAPDRIQIQMYINQLGG